MTRAAMRVGLAIVLLAVAGFSAAAQDTNKPGLTNAPGATAPAASAPGTSTQAPPAQVASRPPAAPPASKSTRLDESAFRIVSERNIFNANRSGGQVRLSTPTRRPARVESFALVGTMAYAKGAFAFFQGSSSELTKSLQPGGVIASHKLVDILPDGVKLEADGKILELAVGSAMRREDEGTWRPGESVASTVSDDSSSSYDGNSSHSRRGEDRGSRADSPGRSTAASSTSSADQSEILKRLMERRAKESQ